MNRLIKYNGTEAISRLLEGGGVCSELEPNRRSRSESYLQFRYYPYYPLASKQFER